MVLDIRSAPVSPRHDSEAVERPRSADGLLEFCPSATHPPPQADAETAFSERDEAEKSEAVVAEPGDSSVTAQLQEQERLIQGYQKENALASQKIKDLEDEVDRLQEQLEREELRYKRQRLQAREETQEREREAELRAKELLERQEQHDQFRKAVSLREQELQRHSAALSQEKKELEANMAGLDLPTIERDDAIVRETQEEMRALKKQHEEKVDSLQHKLRWYTENQDLLTKHEERIRGQELVIEDLQQSLKHAQSRGDGKLTKRNAQLEREVASLREALATRNPDSVAALVQMSKASHREGDVHDLQDQVRKLEAELRRRDKHYEMELRTLRQRYEKLKQLSSERQTRGNSDRYGSHSTAALKEKHNREIQSLRHQLRQVKLERERDAKGKECPSRYSALSALHQQVEKNKKLQALIAEQTDQIASLKSTPYAQPAVPPRTAFEVVSTSSAATQTEEGALRGQRNQRESAPRSLAALEAQDPESESPSVPAADTQGNPLLQELERCQEAIRCLQAEVEAAHLDNKALKARQDSSMITEQVELLNRRLSAHATLHDQTLQNLELTHSMELETAQRQMECQLKQQQRELEKYRSQVTDVLQTALFIQQTLQIS